MTMRKLIVTSFSGHLSRCKRHHIIPSLVAYLDKDPVLRDTCKFSIQIEFNFWTFFWVCRIIRKR